MKTSEIIEILDTQNDARAAAVVNVYLGSDCLLDLDLEKFREFVVANGDGKDEELHNIVYNPITKTIIVG